jgi:hypothetical protein
MEFVDIHSMSRERAGISWPATPEEGIIIPASMTSFLGVYSLSISNRLATQLPQMPITVILLYPTHHFTVKTSVSKCGKIGSLRDRFLCNYSVTFLLRLPLNLFLIVFTREHQNASIIRHNDQCSQILASSRLRQDSKDQRNTYRYY